jgi:hypothetical protein
MARKTAGHTKLAAIDWQKAPDDPWQKVAEVVENINDSSYVPTQVLRDTLEKIKQRHHGDEPTDEQKANVSLIEKELKMRDTDPDYAARREGRIK